jgi:histidinol-phosphate aminotransferase
MTDESLARPAILRLQPYSPGKPIEEVEREYGLTDIVKLASNENPLGPSPRATAAMERALGEVRLYPDNECYLLTQALSRHLGFPEQQIVLGRGSDEVIYMIGLAFLCPGDEVIVPVESFSQYPFTAQLMGVDIVSVPLRDYRYDLPAMAERFTPRTKAVFIANPNNPTGAIVRQREVQEFLDRAPANCVVVLDEAYREYVEDPDYPRSFEWVREDRNVIVLRTFSKIYALAGLRVGYGVGSERLMGYLHRVRAPFNVNNVAQAAALASLGDADQVARSLSVNREGKAYLYREFARLGLRAAPTEANFIFVDVGRDSREVFSGLLRQGVIVRTGDIFGYPTHIRVTIGLPEQNSRFIAALEKVLAASAGRMADG